MLDDEESRSFIDAGDAEGQPCKEGSRDSKRALALTSPAADVLSNSLSNRLTTNQKMLLLNFVALIWGSQHAVMKGGHLNEIARVILPPFSSAPPTCGAVQYLALPWQLSPHHWPTPLPRYPSGIKHCCCANRCTAASVIAAVGHGPALKSSPKIL